MENGTVAFSGANSFHNTEVGGCICVLFTIQYSHHLIISSYICFYFLLLISKRMDRNTINFFQMDFPSWIWPLLILRHLYIKKLHHHRVPTGPQNPTCFMERLAPKKETVPFSIENDVWLKLLLVKSQPLVVFTADVL
jgi:hypothetical protein